MITAERRGIYLQEGKKPIYKRWWAWVLGIIIVWYGVTHSGGGGESQEDYAKKMQSTWPTVNATTTSTSTTKASNDHSDQAAAIMQYLKDNFGETTWGRTIERVEVHGDSVDVYTSIYPDAEGKALAKKMAGYIFGDIRADFFTPGSVTIWCQNDPAATKYDWQG
jgi:hypothetical protein